MGTYTTQDIQTQITRISGSIAGMKTAIAAKGVTVPADSSLSDLDELIMQIGGVSSIILSQNSFSLDQMPHTITIDFVCNVDWTISSNQSWCTFSQNSGNAGVNSISASITENDELAERSCTITVSGGGVSQTISVTQSYYPVIYVGYLKGEQDCWIELPENITYDSKIQIGFYLEYNSGDTNYNTIGGYKCRNNNTQNPPYYWSWLYYADRQITGGSADVLYWPYDEGSQVKWTNYGSPVNREVTISIDNTLSNAKCTVIQQWHNEYQQTITYTKDFDRVTYAWDDTYPAYLFAVRTDDPHTGTTSMGATNTHLRIYFVKLWHGDTLVADLVPIIKNGNTPCFYDNVSQDYIYNGGSGTFSYGY